MAKFELYWLKLVCRWFRDFDEFGERQAVSGNGDHPCYKCYYLYSSCSYYVGNRISKDLKTMDMMYANIWHRIEEIKADVRWQIRRKSGLAKNVRNHVIISVEQKGGCLRLSEVLVQSHQGSRVVERYRPWSPMRSGVL